MLHSNVFNIEDRCAGYNDDFDDSAFYDFGELLRPPRLTHLPFRLDVTLL